MTAELARSLYGSPELRPLWEAARDRLERRGREERGRVTLASLGASERRAIARLVGAAAVPDDGPVWVELSEVDSALRRQATGAGLAEVLEWLGGPLGVRVSAARRQSEARAALFDGADGHEAFARHPDLSGWLSWLRARGMLARLPADEGRRVLFTALDVLAVLPAERVSLPVLAGRATGATHALDRGEPVAVVVDRALAMLSGREPGTPRRDLWAGFGVSLDAVSPTALALGLRGLPGHLGRVLDAAADAGEPVHVTLRMLRGIDALGVPGVVSLCENRSVIEAAADELGARSGPLVCLSGEPSAAGRELVRLLAAGGTRLRYHGDFDAEGIAIADSVIAPGGPAEPWRMAAADYATASTSTPVQEPLGRRPPRAAWDPALTAAMTDAGARIYEEHVIGDLLGDLAAEGVVREVKRGE